LSSFQRFDFILFSCFHLICSILSFFRGWFFYRFMLSCVFIIIHLSSALTWNRFCEDLLSSSDSYDIFCCPYSVSDPLNIVATYLGLISLEARCHMGLRIVNNMVLCPNTGAMSVFRLWPHVSSSRDRNPQK